MTMATSRTGLTRRRGTQRRRLAARWIAGLALASWCGRPTAAGYEARLTLTPPDTVSRNGPVEVRVAIHRGADSPRVYAAELFATGGETDVLLGSRLLQPDETGHARWSAWFEADELPPLAAVRLEVRPQGELETRALQRPLQVVAAADRSLPRFQAAWLDPGGLLPGVYPQRRPPAEADVRRTVDALHAAGVEMLVITYAEYLLNGWGAFYPSQHWPSLLPFDAVGTILDQASANGQHVFVGLGRGHDLYLTWDAFDDPVRLSAGLAHSRLLAQELWDRYGHEPSFYGWYLTHEANDLQRASATFYNPLVEFLRTLAADKPALASPAGTPVVSPEILAGSLVDVFAYQDAVGAGYVPYQYTFDPARRLEQLPEVFARYAAAHQGAAKHLWANAENWQMDGPTYGNPYPADFDRLREQLLVESRYVDVLTVYETFGFFGDGGGNLGLGGPRAAEQFARYRQFVRENGDLDRDGVVDGGDLLLWQRQRTDADAASTSIGDANGDGRIDAGDFALWEAQWGQAAGAAIAAPAHRAAAPAGWVAPEPPHLPWCGLAAAAGGRRGVLGRGRAASRSCRR